MIVMGSNAIPTKSKMIRNGPKRVYGWDIETPPLVPGDGRIPFDHMQPPPGT
jgi:hypothetical protein